MFDEYLASVEHIEQIDAVRNLADADQEEALEDRQEQQIGYTADGGRGRLDDGKPRLDLNA